MTSISSPLKPNKKMIIQNCIICECCKNDLQPEDLRLSLNDEDDLVKICSFCGYESLVNITENEN